MITKTKPRPWTAEDIKNLKDLKKRKYSLKTIAFILERSEVAVQIKWKRLHKKVLTPIFVKKWRNISRVYYIINKYKIDVWRTRGK